MAVDSCGRDQLLVTSLDQEISNDNPVRILDGVIDYLFKEYNLDAYSSHTGKGRPAFPAIDMVKLLIYGYINGITSCRELAKACESNREVQWLIRDKRPKYKTVSNFRSNNAGLIILVFESMVQTLMDEQVISNNAWVIDGHKAKANANRDMLSVKFLQYKLETLLQEENEYMDILKKSANKRKNKKNRKNNDDDSDSTTGSSSSDHDNGESIPNQEEIFSLIKSNNDEIEKIEHLIKMAKEKNVKYISPTDIDSIMLKARRGKCAGHNIQAIVDADSHMILNMLIENSSNDRNALHGSITKTCEVYQVKPKQILADSGYSNFRQIKQLFEEVTPEIYIVPQNSGHEGVRELFKVESNPTRVHCPKGKEMTRRGISRSKGVEYELFYIKDCGSCDMKKTCLKSGNSKHIRISDNHEFTRFYREFMNKPESRAIFQRRKTVIEHVFGTIAHMSKYNGFSLRGRDNVSLEAILYAMAYNFKRLFTMISKGTFPGNIGKLSLFLANFLFSFLFDHFWAVFKPLKARFWQNNHEMTNSLIPLTS